MTGLGAPVSNYASSGEFVESLFQADTLLPGQYHDGFKRQTLEPERELILAVLEDAVVCFQKYLRSAREKEKRLFEDTEEWFVSDDREWIFSFINICDLLGLDPDYVRKGLWRWREAAIAGRGVIVTKTETETTDNKNGEIIYGRQTEDPNERRRHTGGRQPKRADRRRARSAADSRLATVRKARAV
jgi:hypothetical protein